MRFWLACAASLIAGCSRTELTAGPPVILPECVVDSDCPTWGDFCSPVTCEHLPDGDGGTVAHCIQGKPVDCDDNDPCTKDTCDSSTGECHYQHATPDQDGDGFYAPLPGFAPGAPGACGDDCDDTNPNVHPGAAEICDGIDNDCDGIADEGAVYLPTGMDVRISGPVAPAQPGGLGWDGMLYSAAYTGTDNGFNVYVSMLDAAGGVQKPPGEETFTLVNSDASSGGIVWIGDRFGTTWQDRRFGNYQIFFNTVGNDGQKQIPDRRLTDAPGYNVNPTIAWNGTEFLVAWQSDRNGTNFDVYVQRVGADGTLNGENLQLTTGDDNFGNESPQLAPGLQGVGVTWSFGDALHHMVDFQVWSPELDKAITPPIMVTDGTTEAEYPTVVWNRDRYIVAWYDKSASPKAVYASAYLGDGTQLIPPRPITSPGPFRSRYPFLHPLGDRILVVYSDDRDQNQGYELYTTVIHPDLTPLGSELRVTNAPRDSVFPTAAFGHEGNFGVLFRDDRTGGEQDVWFTTLTCFMPGM